MLHVRSSLRLHNTRYLRDLNSARATISHRSTVAMAGKAGYAWDSWGGAPQKMESPSAERNKQVILDELRKHLPAAGLVLEVASGTGQHVSHFAAALSPQLQWQPSDVTDECFGSICAYAAGLSNVRQPVLLDASLPVEQWPVQEPCVAVMAANLTHISPWPVTVGLVAGAGKLLQQGGILFVYGPFKIDGKFTTDSNRQFHETLVSNNPEWGYRDVADITAAAEAAGLEQQHCLPMPANNFVLVYRKK